MYKLLIVDDNNLQLRTIEYNINRSKFSISEIRFAHDGQEGIQVCREFQPHIVITDIVMPGMNGVEMIKHIHREGLNPIFICMSCYDDFEYIYATMQLGVLGYLLKPITETKIEEIMSSAVQKLSETNHAEIMDEKNLELLREMFLYNLIHLKNINTDTVKSVSHMLRLNNYKSYILLKFIVNSSNDYLNYNALIERISKNMICENNGIIILDDAVNEPYLFLMSHDKDNSRLIDSVTTALNANFTDIRDELNANCHALVSEPHNSLFDIQTMLYQIDSIPLQGLRDSLQPYRIYECSCKTNNQPHLNLKDEIGQLIISLPSHNEVSAFVDKIYPSTMNYSKSMLSQIYSEINISLQLFLSEYNLDINDLFNGKDIIGHNISRFDNISRLKIWLKNILNATAEYYKKHINSPQNNLLKGIIEYINNHYTEINSINDVANALYVSKSYTRNIFKKYTGQTIIDYITTLRIDDAKRMLLNTSASIKDISEMVGYKSTSHFRSVFKKHTGISVSEFRKRSRKKDEQYETDKKSSEKPQ